ncbi:MAG: tetratricopeptide repeat protein [Proteobacteria bacterium]|nr:tetratricopeptide repeat protein [Pseudomonadota bacterium]
MREKEKLEEFTDREKDIIACLVSGKSYETVASILSISKRTVEKHVENIKKTMGFDSRDRIIDFIEREGNLSFYQDRYNKLLEKYLFYDHLKQIKQLVPKNFSVIWKVAFQERSEIPSFFQSVLTDLEKAGIRIIETSKKEESSASVQGILCLTETKLYKTDTYTVPHPPTVFIVCEKGKISFQDALVINFYGASYGTPYYEKIFCILKILLKLEQVRSIIERFHKAVTSSEEIFKDRPQLINASLSNNLKLLQKYKKTLFWIGTLCLIIICFLLILRENVNFFPSFQKQTSQSFPNPGFVMLPESELLKRSSTLKEMGDILKGSHIPVVALVGPQGAGKTTIAETYAIQQKGTLVRELNAESIESLMASFECFAEILPKTIEQRITLSDIKSSPHQDYRKEKLLDLIQTILKSYKTWILIYDNVSDFEIIKPYFPLTPSQWGQGYVIITTRNRNTIKSGHINHIIEMGELTEENSLILFSKIRFKKNPSDLPSLDREKIKAFLNHLPPFPYDIAQAATYINVRGVTYEDYLESLQDFHKHFDDPHYNFFHERDEFSKTRYGMIALNFKELIKKNQDYKNLLLIMCLINSQDIPRELLKKYADKVTVINFLSDLKELGLIREPKPKDGENIVFSTHTHTQTYGLAFLMHDQKKTTAWPFDNIVKAFKEYMDSIIKTKDLSQINILVPHMEAFIMSLESLLQGTSILKNPNFSVIKDKLGGLYYRFNLKPFKETQKLLEGQLLEANGSQNQNRLLEIKSMLAAIYLNLGSIKELKSIAEDISLHHHAYLLEGETLEIAFFLSYLGYVYSYLGENSKAREYLEKSVALYNKYPEEKSSASDKAKSLSFLGDLERKEGHYKKALERLNQSLPSYNDSLKNNQGSIESWWFLADIGITYKEMGDFKKAISSLEESYEISKKCLPSEHEDSALPLVHLGEAYIEKACTEKFEESAKEDYIKAEENLTKSIKIMHLHFKKDDVRFVFSQIQLGNLKRLQKDYEESQKILKNSYRIFTKNFGENSIRVWKVTYFLGCLYMDQKEWDLSEKFLKKSLSILEAHKDAQYYRVLESLGDLYYEQSQEKSSSETVERYQKEALTFYQNALKKALSILDIQCVYVKRIQSKIDHMQHLISQQKPNNKKERD